MGGAKFEISINKEVNKQYFYRFNYGTFYSNASVLTYIFSHPPLNHANITRTVGICNDNTPNFSIACS